MPEDSDNKHEPEDESGVPPQSPVSNSQRKETEKDCCEYCEANCPDICTMLQLVLATHISPSFTSGRHHFSRTRSSVYGISLYYRILWMGKLSIQLRLAWFPVPR